MFWVGILISYPFLRLRVPFSGCRFSSRAFLFLGGGLSAELSEVSAEELSESSEDEDESDDDDEESDEEFDETLLDDDDDECSCTATVV